MATNDRIEAGAKVAIEVEREGSPSADVPEEFRHMDERERVQGLNLRKLFAEQGMACDRSTRIGSSGSWARSS
jgi:hypothetical protein